MFEIGDHGGWLAGGHERSASITHLILRNRPALEMEIGLRKRSLPEKLEELKRVTYISAEEPPSMSSVKSTCNFSIRRCASVRGSAR